MILIARISLVRFSTNMNTTRINPAVVRNNSFTGISKINKLVKPFELREIKNPHFLPDLSPANPLSPVKQNIACFKAERMKKEFYTSAGFPYLLPREVWSDKKIRDTIELFGKDLDRMEGLGTLHKITIQKAVDKFLPEHVKGSIIIKDFDDLEKDLRDFGYSEDEIKMLVDANAFTGNTKYKSILYLNFKDANKSKDASISLKCGSEHELTHALHNRLQNTKNTDIYKNDYGVCSKQNKIFNMLFVQLGNHYDTEVTCRQTELTQENMLEWLGFYSIEDLHESFDMALNVFAKKAKISGELNLGSNKKSEEQFFSFLKHRAQEEKEAYQSRIRFRELHKDLYTPTDTEFEILLYEEMEKFFAQKEAMTIKK